MFGKYLTPELMYCSFCGKSHVEVKRIIAGQSVNICDECVLSLLGLPKEATPANAQSESCSFCGKQAREVETVFQHETAQICNECLKVCQEIISCEPETVNV